MLYDGLEAHYITNQVRKAIQIPDNESAVSVNSGFAIDLSLDYTDPLQFSDLDRKLSARSMQFSLWNFNVIKKTLSSNALLAQKTVKMCPKVSIV